ncbi:MAG TPA: hypothetical protein VHQ90_00545 [Thermoanaerobaculia bacterium]|nr:hypothetical protein [Thermoanaerobaculia bacterium]
MDNTLVLCGGTGAHVGVALLRLHTLGYALGYLDQAGQHQPFNFPKVFLVDQDAGIGRDHVQTAWELAHSLVSRHPGQHDWQAAVGSPRGPELVEVTPLPIGPQQDWYKPPFSTLASRFASSELLPALASPKQRQIDYSKGMMGSPAIGSLLFRLKHYDERSRDLNQDEIFSQMLLRRGRAVVAGSGVGGTGAAVGPTLARRLAELEGNEVMAVMILNWFQFIEDESEGDKERREKAQLRNRIMRENANSALEFYGQSLASTVAAVPVGMPERALLRRHFTADLGQPFLESYIHAVAALCAYRHFLASKTYDAGLYIMGAVEGGRLDPRTAIPGGTLQDLANQAATLAELLATWQGVLARDHRGKRVRPAIYDAVGTLAADPGQVAAELGKLIDHFRAQLDWMRDTLAVQAVPDHHLSLEAASRRRLGEERRGLGAGGRNTSPVAIAAALFRWSADWIREIASEGNGLRVQAAQVSGGQWPDIQYDGIGAAARANGDLTRLPTANITAVLDAFVDRRLLSCNGWPHPLAAADFFRHALQHRNALAMRQLELMLAGIVSEVLELRPLSPQRVTGSAISLETLAAEYRRQGYEGLAEFGVYLREPARRLVGFNAPHTLLCPVPRLEDEDDEVWQQLWTTLSGATDDAPWAEAITPARWGTYDLAVRQVRSWLDLQKRTNPDPPPAWAQAFAWYRGDPATFGVGAFITVYWSTAAGLHALRLSLPTPDDDEPAQLPEGTPSLDEAEMFQRVPKLRVLKDNAGHELFSMIELAMPEHEGTVRAWWDDHLKLLLQGGLVDFYSRTESGALVVGVRQEGILHGTVFSNSLVLRRKAILVTSCTPLYQEPVPGSSTPEGMMRYPDIPLNADYLDLVKVPEGGDLIALARRGEKLDSPGWRPIESRDPRGRPLLRWTLDLRGRSAPLTAEIRFDEEVPPAKAHRAHIMIWPRFRTKSGAGWKTYYLYERCTDPRLACDTIWLDAAAGNPYPARLRRRRRADSRDPSYPLSFQAASDAASEATSAEPGHTGGPPLALSLRNTATGEECGLYLVHLKSLPESKLSVSVGLDFGTSHSVAAVRTAQDQAQQVELAPELDPVNAGRGLTLHISEHRSHVTGPRRNAGILASGSWLPTYRERGEGVIPSELLLISGTLDEVRAQNVAAWLPMRDFTIPPIDIERSDLASYVLTDFKWDTGSEYFRGHEPELRAHYLGLLLELVMADVVFNRVGSFPTEPMQITFTYPLRSPGPQVEALRDSLGRVLRRATSSFGINLQLAKGIGIYDESRAASLPTRNLGEVCLVADLGGGTLDLFITAKYSEEREGREADGGGGNDVADSARLGGNLLLRHIAEHPESYLPRDSSWLTGDPREREAKLRTWMRGKGASVLFGLEPSHDVRLEQMDVRGFQKPAEADGARRLLDRYFRLIIDYMARNLVAFLAKQWFPTIDRLNPDYRDKLKISVQLRGNGWRLRYQKQGYVQATQSIQNEVKRRVQELWLLVDGNSYPVPAEDRRWGRPADYSVPDPKPAPIKRVVGEGLAMRYEEVRERWYTHTLVDLKVLRNGAFARIPWYSRVPFATGGSKHVELETITPPLVLSSRDVDVKVEITELDAALQGSVNLALQQDGSVAEGMYVAPVAPLIWEAVFGSRQFWPDQEG